MNKKLIVKKGDWLVRNITATVNFEKIVIVKSVSYTDDIMKLSDGVHAHIRFVDYRQAKMIDRIFNAFRWYRLLKYLRQNIKWLF